jgi:hypothetical protein
MTSVSEQRRKLPKLVGNDADSNYLACNANTVAGFRENLVAFAAKCQEINSVDTVNTNAECPDINMKSTLSIMHGCSIPAGLTASQL